jgi:hypothetical protein
VANFLKNSQVYALWFLFPLSINGGKYKTTNSINNKATPVMDIIILTRNQSLNSPG